MPDYRELNANPPFIQSPIGYDSLSEEQQINFAEIHIKHWVRTQRNEIANDLEDLLAEALAEKLVALKFVDRMKEDSWALHNFLENFLYVILNNMYDFELETTHEAYMYALDGMHHHHAYFD